MFSCDIGLAVALIWVPSRWALDKGSLLKTWTVLICRIFDKLQVPSSVYSNLVSLHICFFFKHAGADLP